jgi:hypothetical protein
VSSNPSSAVPEIVGGDVFIGRVRPTCLGLDFTVVVPDVFVALTVSVSRVSRSRSVGVYVALVAPLMVAHPDDPHRCHRYLKRKGRLPHQAPA